MIVWITKSSTAGDINTRRGVASYLVDKWHELEMPEEYCSGKSVVQFLRRQNLLLEHKAQWPDVIIGPSFHIPFLQEIKKVSEKDIIIVALRHPVQGLPILASEGDINNCALIVSYPYHDNSGLPNLFITSTLANQVTKEKLAQGRIDWRNTFYPYEQRGKIIGLLVGGDIGDKRREFTQQAALNLSRQINSLAKKTNSSVLISLSARTSHDVSETLKSTIEAPYYFFDPKQDHKQNPFFGILAFSDLIVATADSISMCSEAVSSGKPVYIFMDKKIIEDAHFKMASYLVDEGYACFLDINSPKENFICKPINSAKEIAEKILMIHSNIQ